MTTSELSKQLEQVYKKIDETFDTKELDKSTLKFLKKYIEQNFTIKNDRFVIDENSVKALRRLNNELKKHFSNDKNLSDYGKETINLIKNLGTISIDYYYTNGTPLNLGTLGNTHEIVIGKYIDSLTNLNEAFVNPIRNLVTDNILNQTSKTDILAKLESQISGTKEQQGLMRKYLKTNASIVADAYTGSVNKSFYDGYKNKITHIAIEGSIIDTSSVQCKRCVEFYKRSIPINKFKLDILPLAKDNGLIEGTTIENVFTNKLHWGCRHNFVPIIKNL